MKGLILDKSKTAKKKQKRKAKKKLAKLSKIKKAALENGWFHFQDAIYFMDTGHMKSAAVSIKKAAKILPKEEDVFMQMGAIGQHLEDDAMELNAMAGLEKIGKLTDDMKISRIFKLVNLEKFEACIKEANKVLDNFTQFKVKGKRQTKSQIVEIIEYCDLMIEKEHEKAILDTMFYDPDIQKMPIKEVKGSEISKKSKKETRSKEKRRLSDSSEVPEIPVTCKIDEKLFFKALANPALASLEEYELALLSHQIRFTESFETLICLSSLSEVQSFWYQEETAKKVLKQFRGRAMLADEVGLGKTIEALIILLEYIKRGMVKTALILTPAPLVSQWKEEIKLKFNMDIVSTDDSVFKSGSKTFWKNSFIIASINQAKSKKNFNIITARNYDMIIVDEAHHLKNRTTLNWKLVNALKKRFILLLTATPVENNLMELYNLITLLKPGQLDTATAFREKFMKRGDPADPRNRILLKELLNQVMIRNTRALAGINIPPRFAQTIRIEPSKTEKVFYERLENLNMSIYEKKQGRAKMVVKNLLEQAGSSPKAVELSIVRMLEKEDYLLEHEKELKAVKNLCRNTLDTAKNKALMKVIKDTNEKIIVFVKYSGTIEHLAEFLEWNNLSFSLFQGSMNNRQKDEAIEAFKNKHQVLVTTEIGGEGRNLQFCSRMVNYDLPWNPMKIEQRIGRIHRIGQKNQVQIYNFCTAGSIEDYILDVLDRKINMFEMVIGEIDMILGRVRGEKEFSEMVYDIWMNSDSVKEREKSFKNLGTRLKRAKTGYRKTRDLDDKLFGDTYEL